MALSSFGFDVAAGRGGLIFLSLVLLFHSQVSLVLTCAQTTKVKLFLLLSALMLCSALVIHIHFIPDLCKCM